MEIYICSDQPECCRKCGTRTEVLHEFEDDGALQQIHKCPACGFKYQLDCAWEDCEEDNKEDCEEDQ